MKYLVFSLCVLFGLLVSCDDDKNVLPTGSVAAAFTSGISGVDVSSRVSGSDWQQGDTIGIYMVLHGTSEAGLPGLSGGNHPYVAGQSGPSTSFYAVDHVLYYPLNASVNFIAYYPYNKVVSYAVNQHIYPVDITTQDPLSAIDLMYHRGTAEYAITSPSARLEFSHQLSRVTCIVTVGDDAGIDLSAATSAIIGVPSTASFNLADGAFSDVGDSFPRIRPVAVSALAGSVTFECVLIPHSGGDYPHRAFIFTVDGVDYLYAFPDTRLFEQGMAYTYEFELFAVSSTTRGVNNNAFGLKLKTIRE